ncbi:MAG TPA: nucleoside recognition protein [Candidatus Mediterraneibacter caccavium]|uniref:Nucleoside recognition protein n=1 Tax=Candidatus Mediterraneibacter caccavium TaxID=2838661 RepID=A0A9D2AUA0_9FIRM|nr:nucleoside recognition protein [Candidatus Mediterraneibacter caccavium]
MLNYLWAGMILVGIVFGAFNGRMQDITNAALDSSKEAVTLCITMIGVMAFWTGIMEIASKAGIIRMASRKMRPLVRFLFPGMPEGHKAEEHITTNFIANFLGLGWAATPAGLRAMEELGRLEDDRRAGRAPGPVRKKGVAGNEMCTFLIINISSLQLIPMNVIAYRSQYGSPDPAAIIGAGILATMVSTGAAVVFCRMMDRSGKRNGGKRN